MTEKEMLEFISDNAEDLLGGVLKVKIGFSGDSFAKGFGVTSPTHNDFGVDFLNPIMGFTTNKRYADLMAGSCRKLSRVLLDTAKERDENERESRRDGEPSSALHKTPIW